MFLCQPEITRVSATATISLPGLEVPDCVAATFATNTHVVGSLSFGWSTGTTFDLIEVHGSSGSLLVSSYSFEHLTPSSGGFDRLANLWHNAEQLGHRKFKSFVTGHTASEGIAISRHFIDVLRGKTAAGTNARDAVRVLEILDAMKQSLATGQSAEVCGFTRMLT
jgi:predicted dehydrogenase